MRAAEREREEREREREREEEEEVCLWKQIESKREEELS